MRTLAVAGIVSCVLFLFLNGASGRLSETRIQRQHLPQQQQQQYAKQHQQQDEFHHRKLVKLVGEDGTHNGADRIDGKYIVVLNENENLDSFLDSLRKSQPNDSLRIQHEYRHAMVGFSAEIFSQDTLQAILEDARVKEVAEDGHVNAEADNSIVTQSRAPANLDRIDQRTGTDTGFQYRYTGKNDVVYIVDTGVRKTHEDFLKADGVSSRVRDQCFTAFEDDGCHDDTLGHGTHVASIAGGKRWGVAKEVALVSVRVFDAAGVATWSSFTAGIDYCVAQQKNSTGNIIVNISMGGPVNPTFDAAIGVLLEEGAIVVAAAGNQNSFSCSRSPPSALGVIGVGNSAPTDTRDLSSNYGACVDIWAPGVEVKAASSLCDSGDYCWKTLTGTSMASALVSGAYALYLEAKRAKDIVIPSNATRREVAQAIKQKLLADATATPALGVLGSADKLLCIAQLNSANGTSVAALTTANAAAEANTPVVVKKATDAGMRTESIGGSLGSESSPELEIPVGPGGGGNEVHVDPAENGVANKKNAFKKRDKKAKKAIDEPEPTGTATQPETNKDVTTDDKPEST